MKDRKHIDIQLPLTDDEADRILAALYEEDLKKVPKKVLSFIDRKKKPDA